MTSSPRPPDEERAERLAAELYDEVVADWPGELAFYRRLAAEAAARGHGTLEVACGTGRVARRLVDVAPFVVGVDLSPLLLEVARSKSVGVANLRFALGDMRAFSLPERFGLAIVPGHAFQFMLTADDQVRALTAIAEHLEPDGRAVLHLDLAELDWLWSLPAEGGTPEPGAVVVHPRTGQRWRPSNTWTYARAGRNATVVVRWDRLDDAGGVVETVVEPARTLHNSGPVEIGHAVGRAGLAVEALLGDFEGSPFGDESSQMLWIVRRD